MLEPGKVKNYQVQIQLQQGWQRLDVDLFNELHQQLASELESQSKYLKITREEEALIKGRMQWMVDRDAYSKFYFQHLNRKQKKSGF